MKRRQQFMRTIRKIKFLVDHGEKIEYYRRPADNRLFITYILLDGEHHHYFSTTNDQFKARADLDLLWMEWHKNA